LSLSLGLSLGRRTATLVVVETVSRTSRIVQHSTIPRNPGDTPESIVSLLLKQVGPEHQKSPLTILLSPGDAACSDSWIEERPHSRAALERLGPALSEARSAGESVEELAVHLIGVGRSVRSIAVRRELLGTITRAAQGWILSAVSSIPAALAAVFPGSSLTVGGERFEIGTDSWRAFPVDQADEEGVLRWREVDVPLALAAAFSGAIADPDLLPNALLGTSLGRPSFLRRFAQPLVGIGAAAALCLAALGVRCHREAERVRAELRVLRGAERELWTRTLPLELPREGGLFAAMKKRLVEIGEAPGAAGPPSALSFWAEIARQMPDADAAGVTLESLDLAADGGRLSARLPAGKEDPLEHASHLEGMLNRSDRVKVRGDYEVREGQVHVRLRMDYRP